MSETPNVSSMLHSLEEKYLREGAWEKRMVVPCAKIRVDWQTPPHRADGRGLDTGGSTPMPEQPNPYEDAAAVLLKETGCTVRKWRKNTTGRAFTKADDWGIEAPRPRGPISFATFAHEIGHQVKHRFNSSPRWLEELEAWEYALEQFDRFELDGKDKAQADAARSLVWAAAKTEKRCSPETAQALIGRYPDWVWTEGTASMTYLDVAIRAGVTE